MRDKPESCYSSGCPLANVCQCTHLIDLHLDESNCTYVNEETGVTCKCNAFKSKGRGFVLGSGDPNSAKYMFVFEAPGRDEVGFRLTPVEGRSFFSTQTQVNEELARRKVSYPLIDVKYLKSGAPIVGATGVELEMWGFPKAGIQRDELFIDNTLRCLPPKGAKGAYPTGEEKKKAELCCRQYDRFHQFKPDVALVQLHPAGILREITPLPLQVADLQKVRDFQKAGFRPLVLLGGKAAQAFLRYGENVTKWRGHYQWLKDTWTQTYRGLFAFKEKVKRKPGPKKGAKAVKAASEKKAESFKAWDHLFQLTPNLPKVYHKKKLPKGDD